MIDIVSATRLSEDQFWTHTALGISLGRMMLETRINACPIYDNKRGLGEWRRYETQLQPLQALVEAGGA